MRILYLATRAPYGRMHGHKIAIRTYIQALGELGHDVVVCAFEVPGDTVDQEDLGVTTRYLPLPSKATILRNIVRNHVFGEYSLNECLYESRQGHDAIAGIVRQERIDFVIADMLRTAPYAARLQLPWFIDVDDLLSDRYAMWASRASGNEAILGYLETTIPSPLRPAAKWVFRRALHRESKVMARREAFWAERALGSSLRSRAEAAILAGRAPRGQVFCLPLTVPIPAATAVDLQTRPMRAVFTGGLTYQPNLDALRHYVQRVLPEFDRQGVTPPHLHVIGAAPDRLRQGIEHPSLTFLGYVPDVNEELAKAQVFFAPIISGTGIKTKVLEALACGLPVIGLPFAMTGLDGEAGRDYLVAETEVDFVRQFCRLRDDPEHASALGRSARTLAIETYSLNAAVTALRPMLNSALALA